VGDTCGGGVCNSGAPITSPQEVADLTSAADNTTFTWPAVLDATSYDVVRGLTSALAVGPGGEFRFGGPSGAALVGTAVPAPGTAFWYLARGDNACGIGSYGQQNDGTSRLTSTCP